MGLTANFTKANVVVVGGTSGINRGIALAFARAGAKVAVASRSQEKVDDWTSSLFPDSLITDPMRPFSRSYLRTLVLVFYNRWRSGGADGCRRPRYIRGLQPWLPPVF